MRFNFPRLLAAVLALSAPCFAVSAELPNTGLEERIGFWKKVYTQYGENDVIIHDRLRVNLIYDVADRRERASKVDAIENAFDEIRANLDSPESLSGTARQVRDTIVAAGLALNGNLLTELQDNIHTQLGIKERFRNGIIRSGRYIDAFRAIFEDMGIPTEIALLPLVESSFENRALSSAGAAGIWQFTRGTARLYMTVSRKVDQRLNPETATRAAARLLRDNYNALGSWPLAITAYNHGRAGMVRAKNEVGSSDITKVIDEYQGPLFGYASMNFYAVFLAAVEVYNSYEQHFGQLVLDKPTMKSPAPKATAVAAAKAPAKKAAATASAASDKYRVRRGDTLTQIARRFGTSVRELMDTNNLRNHVIHAGQILLVR
jgi:membrane-bound lytic murein transglycosylase D